MTDMVKCPVPNSCLTINPDGTLAPCCQASLPFERDDKFISLQTTDSLLNFFNSPFLNNIRENIKTKGIHPRLCNECIDQHNNNERTFIDMYDDTLVRLWKINRKDLSYLELTTSNLCNQTCTTCNGFLSSAWNILDKKILKAYPGLDEDLSEKRVSRHWIKNDIRLTQKDIDKIKPILPKLRVFCIKGGEPFADKKNMDLLEYLAKVNPDCYVQIITNFTLVDKYIHILKKFRRLDVDASVDGLYDQYEWMRSSKWKKLLEQMDLYIHKTRKQTMINITVSIYNYFNLHEIIKYWDKSPYSRTLAATNIVHHPKISSFKFLKQDYLNMFYDKIDPNFTGIVLDRPTSFKDQDLKFSRKFYYQKMQKWIDVMDSMRGFKLVDSVPELNLLEEMIL